MNKHLKPGVAVDVRGASDEDVQAVIEACVRAGAHRSCDSGEEFVKWGVKGAVWSSFSNGDIDGILPIISINQALGRESEVENTWFERGELPRAGTVCEVSINNSSFEGCEILLLHKGVVVFCNNEYTANVFLRKLEELTFRPLKTEKEKFVERYVVEVCANSVMARASYDKGLRFTE